MKITLTASLPASGSWFSPHKDGSGVLRLEIPASDFAQVIQLSTFMDVYTGGATFRVQITDEP